MIYIVTAVHNRHRITEKFVNQLLVQTYKEIKLILVDDGSTDGTADMVKAKMADAVIIQGDGKLWWGGALHEAYKWLKANADRNAYVMFANDDITFDKYYIETAINLLKKDPDSLVTGCGYSVRTGRQMDGAVHWNYKIGGIDGGLMPTDEGNCASTRSLFMTVPVNLKIGGFHPVLLPHYASDYEWTTRGSKKGISVKSFEELKYYYDERTTGDNNIETVNLKKVFSKRSNMNPFYRLNFILMSTPIKYLPGHLCYQVARYVNKVKKIKSIVKR